MESEKYRTSEKEIYEQSLRTRALEFLRSRSKNPNEGSIKIKAMTLLGAMILTIGAGLAHIGGQKPKAEEPNSRPKVENLVPAPKETLRHPIGSEEATRLLEGEQNTYNPITGKMDKVNTAETPESKNSIPLGPLNLDDLTKDDLEKNKEELRKKEEELAKELAKELRKGTERAFKEEALAEKERIEDEKSQQDKNKTK